MNDEKAYQEWLEHVENVRQLIPHDPEYVCQELFGLTPTDNQVEIIKASFKYRQVNAVTCHKVGKDLSSAAITYLWLYHWGAPSKVVTTANNIAQVKDILWDEIRSLWKKAEEKGFAFGPEPSQLKWDIGPNHLAIGMSPDINRDNTFQGFNSLHTLVILDEADGIPAPIWEGAKGMTSNEGSCLLALGNPVDPESYFCDEVTSEIGHTIRISAYDTPNFKYFGITEEDIIDGSWEKKVMDQSMPFPFLIAPQYAADKAKKTSDGGVNSTSYLARVKAVWPKNSEHALFPGDLLQAAFDRWNSTITLKDILTNESTTIGQDVASKGKDGAVQAMSTGLNYQIYKKAKNQRQKDIESDLRQLCLLSKARHVVIDEVGIGTALAESMEDHPPPGTIVHRVGGARKSFYPERFFNLRSELYWKFRELLFEGKIALKPNKELKHQMSKIKYQELKEDMMIKVQPKADYKKENKGQSPDEMDALMLTMMPLLEGDRPGFAFVEPKSRDTFKPMNPYDVGFGDVDEYF